ncbi:NAD(P)/FAD-dependent oxidoreductase [Parapedobacter tibetensis]|uniref:NAD(P)/FAD-dependent oxidoreductase n=1 Tax=Parapedobacter tibetensis TaxID=2972951 RepID=UPI00214D525A|nr:NAD(P)/FAD-dependent oxidoreductase [Parapedobacter tibetensis]
MTFNTDNQYDAIIIGGGACGLMCAVQAGMLGKRTLVLERNDRPGAKILISGGGRCNYTNLYTTDENFVSSNPAFSNQAFSTWTVEDTVAFFERQGIVGKEKTLGQLFPVSDKAKDVVAVFTRLMLHHGQELRINSNGVAVKKLEDGRFRVSYEDNGTISTVMSNAVVMASGGLPVAKLGASDFALRVAREFELDVVPTAPALVPLTITGKDAEWFATLSGNSVFCRVYNESISFEENMLFTHWGLSGPAILQISSYWKPGETITLNLLPHHTMEQLIKTERQSGGKRLVSQLLSDFFSRKLVESMGKFLPIDTKIASLSKADANQIATTIHRFNIKPAGDKGYDKAEVMRGGVATHELNPKTLESKKVPGLYFGGECVDMTGWLGGYNFQWAWASGYVIAQAI